MPLDKSALASELENVFGAMLPTASDVADALASVYTNYAKEGRFGSSTPQIPPAKTTALAATLLAAIADPAAGSPATFAGAWASGLAAFWAAVPVVGAQSGAVGACPGAASMLATLSLLFANQNNSLEDGAKGLADALHIATLTVTAAVVPPPGTVLPIL